MAKKNMRMGAVQFRIMEVLWKRERAKALEITGELTSPRKPVAHSTVQTLLRKLMNKGAVGYDKKDRTFVFYPVVTREEVVCSSTRDLLSRMFGGSPYELVAHLIREDMVSRGELSEIKKLITQHERAKKK